MTALTLFNLATEYRQAADQLADMDMDLQTMSDTLEGMSGDLETKATNVAYIVRNFEASSDAIKAHAQTQLERAKAIEKRADHLRDYLKSCMELAGITKIEAPGVVINFRKSEAVVINEPGLIPAEFMRQPETPPPQPDKAAIKAALKAKLDVPGAHIDERQNLQIK